MKKKITFCFDIDNTICKTSLSNYNSSVPDKKAIKMINRLYEKGHIIKINTARYMGRNKDNISKSKKEGYKKTIIQLKNWGLKFHKLYINKPSSDIYIDDKSYGYNKRWKLNFKKYLQKNLWKTLCSNTQINILKILN